MRHQELGKREVTGGMMVKHREALVQRKNKEEKLGEEMQRDAVVTGRFLVFSAAE